jgi:hypothetical protein
MKKMLFILIMAIFWFPIIQEKFKLFSFYDLNGVTTPTEKPKLTKHDWFEGSFQAIYEGYQVNNYGFRNPLIRLYNQFDYSLFRHTHSAIVVGKDDYLFEANYLNELIGENRLSEKELQNMLDGVAQTQKYLSDRNITLITMLAPGKSYYYEEYIPDYYKERIDANSNYRTITRLASDMDLNLIDANSWFLKMKDTIRYPLFPRQGIHWNYYGATLATDSLIRYIEFKKGIELPDFTYTIEFPPKLQGSDNDLGDLLNLLFAQKNPLMPYPKYAFQNNREKKLSMLTIGDSFYWTIYNSGIIYNEFKYNCYYYYNSSIHDKDGEHAEKTPDVNLLSELKKHDVILFIHSTPNDHDLGWGFVKSLKNNIKRYEELKNIFLNRIENENRFGVAILDYIKRNNVSVDSARYFIADSISMAYMDKVASIKINMRRTPQWFAQLEEKSKTWGVKIEDAMDRDAEWVMQQDTIWAGR